MTSDRRRTPRRSCERIQIFVKAEVGKTVALDVTLRDKAKDVKNEMCCSTDVAYVSFAGDEMRACGVEDGCTVKVRGGGVHKNEKLSKRKKKAKQRPTSARASERDPTWKEARESSPEAVELRRGWRAGGKDKEKGALLTSLILMWSDQEATANACPRQVVPKFTNLAETGLGA